mmetsp:Transcript_66303/g.176898  ORF Transcript_66303/g.176898 Transcript_66303/m.176898 type:complete len:237 (+) Transcript_66303:223-933(+)
MASPGNGAGAGTSSNVLQWAWSCCRGAEQAALPRPRLLRGRERGLVGCGGRLRPCAGLCGGTGCGPAVGGDTASGSMRSRDTYLVSLVPFSKPMVSTDSNPTLRGLDPLLEHDLGPCRMEGDNPRMGAAGRSPAELVARTGAGAGSGNSATLRPRLGSRQMLAESGGNFGFASLCRTEGAGPRVAPQMGHNLRAFHSSPVVHAMVEKSGEYCPRRGGFWCTMISRDAESSVTCSVP